jgi:hypothetical protein
LAEIHALRPPQRDLAFLGAPDPEPALAEVRLLRSTLDGLQVTRPRANGDCAGPNVMPRRVRARPWSIATSAPATT